MQRVSQLLTEAKHREAWDLLDKLPHTLAASAELAIISYYLGERRVGQLHSTISEVANKAVSRDLAVRNSTYYLELLDKKRVVDLRPVTTREGFSPCNPSIVKYEDGWAVSVRTVNYRQKGGIWEEIPPVFGGRLVSENYLIKMNSGLERLSEEKMKTPQAALEPNSIGVSGVEDLRLFEEDGLKGAFFLAEGRPGDAEKRGCQAVLDVGRFETAGESAVAPVTKMGRRQNIEKNWLPFSLQGRRSFLYSYDPLTVVGPRGETVLQTYAPYNFRSFKGSAGPVPFRGFARAGENEATEGGYLVVIHETARWSTGSLVYFHRFLRYDANFNFVDISLPFMFEHRGVEFCSGLAIDGQGDLLITYGVEDCEAKLAVVSRETVASLWLNLRESLEAYLVGENC